MNEPWLALERLASFSTDGFPSLFKARTDTAAAIEAQRLALAGVPLPPDAAVTMFGSWGRHELTEHSDHDWLLLVHGPRATDGAADAVARLRGVLSAGTAAPGSQEVFGEVAYSTELVQRIGLQHDDNRNLTRRMLLMLESQPVANDAVHRACWDAVLDGYLDESVSPHAPPRFFLNDLVRYWRTICVDFVGKEREDAEKWGLRSAKLRTSRKVLFAGGLVPLLLSYRFDADGTREHLRAQLRLPATERLALAFLDLGAVDAGVRTLGAYDRWIGMLGDAEVRDRLRHVTRENADGDSVYQEVRTLAATLQRGLLALLFETSPQLAAVVREYAIF